MADETVAPNSEHADETGAFPWENIKAINQIGLNGIFIPESFGGIPMSYKLYLETVSIISEACASTGIIYATTFHGMKPLIDYGTDEQRQRPLPAIAEGGVGALAITESNAGSDATGMTTRFTANSSAAALGANDNPVWRLRRPTLHLQEHKTMSRELPVPIINADSAPYWEGARCNKLLLQRCTDCHTFRFFPRYLCTHCGSDQVEWVEASGGGTVHSFTIVHRAAFPEFQARTPYVVALIDLVEGPRMMTNIIGEDALNIDIGDAVEVMFEPRGEDGAKVPQFCRRAGGNGS